MGDPEVIYLRYELVGANDATDLRADSVEFSTEDFSVHVGDDTALPVPPGVPVVATTIRRADAIDEPEDEPDPAVVIVMKTHFPTVESAREQAEPFLRAWALDAALSGFPRFECEYVGSLVLDRNPPPGQEGDIQRHDPDRHDDRAVALALAASALVEQPLGGGGEATFGFEPSMIRETMDADGWLDRVAPLRYDMPF